MTSPPSTRLEETRSPIPIAASEEGAIALQRSRGLVSKHSADGVSAFWYPPPADLADVIEKFWVGRWDLPAESPHQTELLGDPCMHIAFERCGTRVESRLVGVWTKLWIRTLANQGLVRAAKLKAGCGSVFWPAPAVRFSNRITPLHAVIGPTANQLENAILSPPNDELAFLAFADWLRQLKPTPHPSDAQLASALVARVQLNPEITRVEHLVLISGLGKRALQQLFRDHVGASPKWVICRNRLQEVATQLENGVSIHLAQLAVTLGYADQAHLTRDFKAATGKTPREFVRLVR